MQRTLSFDGTPGLSVPLPFLLCAPLFAVIAGITLLWLGADALQSRWAPATIALTHLLTLGYLALVMVGATWQMLPVVAGLAVPGGRALAHAVFGLLAAGALALPAGIASGAPPLLRGGALALGLALGCFVGASAWALRRAGVAGARAMVNGMRLAIAGLAVTVLLGLSLAAWLAGLLVLPAPLLANLHAAWGVLGWVAMLVIAVAFQVIPMFQGAQLYPRRLEALLPAALALALLVWSAAHGASTSWQRWAAAAVVLPLTVFCTYTLWLLARRKRQPDVTTGYWTIALSSMLAAVVAFLAGEVTPPLLLGVLGVVGFAMSAVNGMLYKIVPFLLWYHLADAGLPRAQVPGVNKWLAARGAAVQCALHALSVLVLAAACWLPALARLGGLLFLAASLLLATLLWRAALRYRRIRRSALVGL